MEVNTPQVFGRNSASRRRDLIAKFDLFVDLFAKEISRYNPVQADSEIVHFLLNTLSDILEDGFVLPELGESEYDESGHYWSKISQIVNSDAMKFVNSLDQFSTDSEKAYVWILIELHDRNLATVFDDIFASTAIMKHYKHRALMIKHAPQINEILQKLSKIEYKIESKFLKAYQEHMFSYYNQYADPDENAQARIISSSPSHRRSSDFILRKGENSEIFHKSSEDSPSVFPVASSSLENTRTSSLFKSGSSLKVRADMNIDKGKDSLDIDKNTIDIPRFEEVDGSPSINSREETKGENKRNLSEDEVSASFTPKWRRNKRASTIRRSSSFHGLNPNLQDSPSQDNHVVISPLQYSNHSPRSARITLGGNSPSREGTPLRTSGYQIHESPMPSEGEGAEVMSASKKRLVILGFSGIRNDLQSTYDTPIFRGTNRQPTTTFSSTNVGQIPIRNSEVLYADKYQKIQYQYEYRECPHRGSKDQNHSDKCFSCGTSLNKKIFLFWSKKGYCHYTGYWYCSDCMSSEQCIIPWYVTEQWDFRPYTVCKKAYEELTEKFDKPNVIIDYNSPVVEKHKILYETLVTRRQLHLMFDMACETDYIMELMRDSGNLLLKQNLFSLKNLMEASRGTMLKYLEQCYIILSKHAATCETCQSKGKVCGICNNSTKIFPHDIKNTAICKTCKHLYHSKCFLDKKCPICK